MTAGDRVIHKRYGRGTVLSAKEEARQMAAERRGYEQTFAPVDPLKDHFHGNHWAVLEAEAVEFLALLPEIVAGGVPRDPFEVPRLYMPPEEPHGINLTWPVPREGVVVAVRMGQGEAPNEVLSVYPRIQLGTQHRVAIERAYPWQGRVEGQIQATLGDAAVTFFDVFYATHKWCYRAGREYEFILTGLAYDCRVVDSEPLVIRGPEAVRVLSEASGRAGSPVEIQTTGMAMMLPVDEWDRDDYRFQGPVKAVTATEFLGRKVWRLRVTVLRRLADHADIDLDVYAAPRPGASRRTGRRASATTCAACSGCRGTCGWCLGSRGAVGPGRGRGAYCMPKKRRTKQRSLLPRIAADPKHDPYRGTQLAAVAGLLPALLA